jgi:hypothetical protein
MLLTSNVPPQDVTLIVFKKFRFERAELLDIAKLPTTLELVV